MGPLKSFNVYSREAEVKGALQSGRPARSLLQCRLQQQCHREMMKARTKVVRDEVGRHLVDRSV